MGTVDKQQLTPADLNMILVAAKILGDRHQHVLSIQFYQNYSRTALAEVHVLRETFKQLVAESGADVDIQTHGATGEKWIAMVLWDQILFYALFKAEELPTIGYHVPPHVAYSGPAPVRIGALQLTAPT